MFYLIISRRRKYFKMQEKLYLLNPSAHFSNSLPCVGPWAGSGSSSICFAMLIPALFVVGEKLVAAIFPTVENVAK